MARVFNWQIGRQMLQKSLPNHLCHWEKVQDLLSLRQIALLLMA